MTKTVMTPQVVQRIAQLANIPITPDEEKTFADGFIKTLEVVDQLNQVDTSGVEPTHQVTGLKNVFREDVVDDKRMFSQTQALSNAPETHDGFIVVDQVLRQE